MADGKDSIYMYEYIGLDLSFVASEELIILETFLKKKNTNYESRISRASPKILKKLWNFSFPSFKSCVYLPLSITDAQ